MPPESQTESTSWGDLLRGTDGVICWIVILATALHATQILVIAIIMPTVVADIGGAAYYTWPTMLYTIGAIVGAACVGPLWASLGRRNGFAASAAVFLIGSVGCALAPDITVLNAARMVQGFAGGLLNGGGLALISARFSPARRKRALALTQAVWMFAQLSGPVIGGAFAEIGWWRGTFWVMFPLVAVFIALVYLKLPDDPGDGYPPEVEALCARKNGGEDLVGFGGCEDEKDVRGRLFESFQERVEGALREHVDLVEDVDFLLRTLRRNTDGVPELTDVVYAVVARGINFDDVHRAASLECLARFAHAAGLGVFALLKRRRAIDGLGEDPRCRCFSYAARATEEIGVRQPVQPDGVAQRLRHMCLPHHLPKRLRAVFARRNEVAALCFGGVPAGVGWAVGEERGG